RIVGPYVPQRRTKHAVELRCLPVSCARVVGADRDLFPQAEPGDLTRQRHVDRTQRTAIGTGAELSARSGYEQGSRVDRLAKRAEVIVDPRSHARSVEPDKPVLCEPLTVLEIQLRLASVVERPVERQPGTARQVSVTPVLVRGDTTHEG